MSGAWIDAGDAALNAAFGDTLAERGSPLAIDMAFYDRGARATAPAEGAQHVVVFVHGLGCNERCWSFPGEPELDYGRLLARDLHLTPLYVRYNTGLPIFENGLALAGLLEDLVTNADAPIESLTLIGHSLGGLVIRSACHYGAEHTWSSRVRCAFYVGSPHLGSPVARVGHLVAAALDVVDEPVVNAVAEVAELRSAAVRDLRRGDLVEGGADVPLDPRIEHYAVGGTLRGAVAAFALGDGLVRLDSASAGLETERVGVFPGLAHLTLAHHADVYAWIAARCGPPRDAPVNTPRPVDASPRKLSPYVSIVADAVGAGATTIQTAHEAIAARPYDVIEAIEPLAPATRAVRSIHFGVMRTTYASVRAASAWLGGLVRPTRAPAGSRDRR